MIVVPQLLIRWQWLKATKVRVPWRVKAILGLDRTAFPVRPKKKLRSSGAKRRRLERKLVGAAVAMRQLVKEYVWSESEGVETDSEVSDSSEDMVQETPSVPRVLNGWRVMRLGSQVGRGLCCV
ncbi:hypothetical protein SARC_02865 [Sphaeroforma arctica JP610]|uniref:Uncharacterized protein n=1 Tax=Sphaeroforma arctica JP610 TaxID=667725 RepID=A0A0L0G9K2_9EUKA|nr:hypothetical protein SARC_02865 [Sphaeroforma arctica JP610]KNC84943.1 hypothetical protein SARC_02865 [Sphaeroforma arctica JP610]|eukprot:XP_014158845.1 hypothetical protein SARC_02865 [Sphaeroforma arctica JP610]